MKPLKLFCLTTLVFLFPFIHINGSFEFCTLSIKGHRLLIGPEVYHVHRNREGGSKQNGWLGGGRFTYDHYRRHSFYWALEGAIARGKLHGKSKLSKQESHMRDRSIEGRLGYTFRIKRICKLMLTPFIGGGYMIEDNDFRHPSPLHLHFKTAYSYASAGLLSSISLGCQWKLGLTVKLRYLFDPTCKITHDPDFRSTSLKIANDNLQYRLELPVTYNYCHGFSLVATPFYESRIYGRQIGFPFDYLQTRIYDYGVILQAHFGY
ncbi:MAG: hypothetical protein H0W50_03430 [Parachlamydiaceae bacterium]|nr:hypothetical protein [Parachlamydiaceae bacterium]